MTKRTYFDKNEKLRALMVTLIYKQKTPIVGLKKTYLCDLF